MIFLFKMAPNNLRSGDGFSFKAVKTYTPFTGFDFFDRLLFTSSGSGPLHKQCGWLYRQN